MPIIIPTGVKTTYTQTSSLDWSERLNCASCGLEFKAQVHTTAYGQGSTGHFTSRESASYQAGVDSFTNAMDNGRRLIRSAPCPSCGKRMGGDREALVSASGPAFLLALVAGFLLLPSGFFVGGLSFLTCWVGLTLRFARNRSRVGALRVSFEQVIRVPEHMVARRKAQLEAVLAASAEPVPEPPPREQEEPPVPAYYSREGEREVTFAGSPDEPPLELDLDRKKGS